MALSIPPAVNYPSPLVAVPVRDWDTPPSEGRRAVPVYIDWGIHGGTAKCVSLDVGGNTYAPMSRIVGVSVDNARSGADVTIVFPDTMATLAVPAGAEMTAEAFTNGTAVFIFAPAGVSGDNLSLAFHNTLPPPIALPRLVNQSVAVQAGGAITIGTTALVAAGINGTLGNVLMTISAANAAAASNFAWRIADGNAVGVLVGTVAFPAASYANAGPISVNGINVRFQNGLNLVLTGVAPSIGSIYTNILYHVP